MDRFLIGVIATIIIVSLAMYAVAVIIVAVVIVGSIAGCLISIYVVKTKQPLWFSMHHHIDAVAYGLLVGIICPFFVFLGTLGFRALMEQHAPAMLAGVADGAWWQETLWDAGRFAVGATVTVYIANVVSLARARGARMLWLQVIPPLVATVAFLLVYKSAALDQTYKAQGVPAALAAFVVELWGIIISPAVVASEVLKDHDAPMKWIVAKVTQSNGSLFKLLSVYPSILWVLALSSGLAVLLKPAGSEG